MRSKEQPDQRSLSRAIHIGFVITGVVTTLLGPILPLLSSRWSIDDSQAGYLFTSQFAGSLCGMLASNWMAARLGLLRALLMGFGLMAIGTGLLSTCGWPAGVFFVFCYGLGLGVTIPLCNLAISDFNPGNRASALNVLNFCWSIGAVAGPPLIAAQMRHSQKNWGLLILSMLLVGMVLRLSLTKQIESATSPSNEPARSESASINIINPTFAAIGVLAFIYVGTETSVGGWASSYALRADKSSSPFWMTSQAIFWAALLAGRGSAPVILRYLSDGLLVLVGLLLAGFGLCLLLISKGMLLLGFGLVLIGAGFGPVYPTTTAVLLQFFGRTTPRIVTAFFALSSLGGAVIPWIVGWISDKSGSLRMGLSALLICGLAMLMLQFDVARRLKQNDSRSTSQ